MGSSPSSTTVVPPTRRRRFPSIPGAHRVSRGSGLTGRIRERRRVWMKFFAEKCFSLALSVAKRKKKSDFNILAGRSRRLTVGNYKSGERVIPVSDIFHVCLFVPSAPFRSALGSIVRHGWENGNADRMSNDVRASRAPPASVRQFLTDNSQSESRRSAI
jgi:hypothetical protein